MANKSTKYVPCLVLGFLLDSLWILEGVLLVELTNFHLNNIRVYVQSHMYYRFFIKLITFSDIFTVILHYSLFLYLSSSSLIILPPLYTNWSNQIIWILLLVSSLFPNLSKDFKNTYSWHKTVKLHPRSFVSYNIEFFQYISQVLYEKLQATHFKKEPLKP